MFCCAGQTFSRDTQICQAWFPTTVLIFGGKWDMINYKHYFPKEDFISLTIYNPQITKYNYLGISVIFQWLFQLLPNCVCSGAIFSSSCKPTTYAQQLGNSQWLAASGMQPIHGWHTHSLGEGKETVSVLCFLVFDYICLLPAHKKHSVGWPQFGHLLADVLFRGICCSFYIEWMRLNVYITTCVPVYLSLLLNPRPTEGIPRSI